MVYGYARVSSKGQEAYGNGLEVQEQQLHSEGASVVYSEACTGTTMDRPVWAELMEVLESGDTLVVSKLDRIARTSSGGFQTVRELLDRGVRVHILNMGLIDNTPTGRLILNIMFSFAEFERDIIVERMAEGKEVARRRDGYREGRPRIETDSERVLRLVESERAGEITPRQAADELGVSLRTWYRRRSEALKGVA